MKRPITEADLKPGVMMYSTWSGCSFELLRREGESRCTLRNITKGKNETLRVSHMLEYFVTEAPERFVTGLTQ